MQGEVDRWHRIVETMPQLVLTADAGGVFDYVGPQAVEFSGKLERELHGTGWLDLIHPEDRAESERAWIDSVRSGSDFHAEHRLRRHDGIYLWFFCRARAVHDAGGRVVQWTATCVDVDDRVKAAVEARVAREQVEEEARRIRERLDQYVWASGAIIIDVDLSAGVLPGDARDRYLGGLHHPDARMPSNLEALLSNAIGPDRDRFLAEFMACLRGETPELHVEYRERGHPDGELYWRQVRGRIVRDEHGSPVRFTGGSYEITKVKLAEAELREAKNRLEIALRGGDVSILDVALQGKSDLAALQNFSITEPRGVATPRPDNLAALVRRAVIPEDQDRMIRLIEAFLRGESQEFLAEFRAAGYPDGKVHWRQTHGFIVRDEKGSPLRFVGTAHEITKLKAVEEEARCAVEQLRLATRLSGAYVWSFELVDGSLSNAQATFINVWESLGYEADEVPSEFGSSVAFVILPEDQARVFQAVQACITGEAPHFEEEYRIRHKDGSLHWNLGRGLVTRDTAGRPLVFTGTSVDVTHLKSIEEESRKTRDRLELAVLGSRACTWDFEMDDGQIANARAVFNNVWESLGYSRAEAAEGFAGGLAWLLKPEHQAPFVADVQAFLDGEDHEWEREIELLHKDGLKRWQLSRGVVERGAGGRAVRFIGTGVDITDRKRIENELQRAREVAEAANRSKDEFLANVSHEIRTPMNAIVGMTELALESAPNEHQRQLLSTVQSAARNLLAIINDLLDFSKIAAGKMTLDEVDFSVRVALGETLRSLHVRAHRKGLELIGHVGADVPDVLTGDVGRLRQVLLNLVGNAIKFTPHGEVEVAVAAAPSSDPRTISLIITVRDTGIGIARAKQAAIFRAFEQEDSSTTRKYGGTGLGLTISAQLAALMRGDITVESEPARGSTFRFTTRFTRSPRAGMAGPSLDLLAGQRVLVVDDNETSRAILQGWLTSWGMRPSAAADARSAQRALELANETGALPSLALLDEGLPDVDGTVLAAHIRERFGASSPHLVLLSPEVCPSLVERSRESGIAACLLKPVQQSELLETIYGIMSGHVTVTAPAAHPHTAARLPLRVLVAEDNELNVALLQELLLQRGHHAQFARDGLDALALAKEGACDLLLLDLHMPDIDGFDVVQAIRGHEQGTRHHLPIIALTARSSVRDRERCVAAGMDDFLPKPIEASLLWSAIDRLVVRFPPPNRAPSRRDLRLLDARAILRACGGQASALDRLRLVLRQTLPEQMARVRAALVAGDLLRLRGASHQLLGTVGTFSTVTADLASTLEDSTMRDEHDSLAPLVERLESMCEELLEATATLSIDLLAL
jgi:two-component system sensor histidine kinase/response regulator